MSQEQSLNVLILGGSRNIGYYTALRFLQQGATVTFMLRNTGVFDEDQDVQKYIKSGKAFLVKGDSMNEDDIKNAWLESESVGPERVINVLLSTIGSVPVFKLSKGFVMDPENLVTVTVMNILCGTPVAQSPLTRFITITSTGLTHDSHKALPFALRGLYKYALAPAHRDKLGAERAIAYSAGWSWDAVKDGEPKDSFMGTIGSWKERKGLPAPGTLKNVVVIRPILYASSGCKADTLGAAAYRVSEHELKDSYTISRKDVAHFTFELATSRWEEFAGKGVDIGY